VNSIAYSFDPGKFHLGSLCGKGHSWPGTSKSLRRTYFDKNGKPCHGCVACRAGKRGWLVSFIDQKASGAPEGFRIGPLCKRSHFWNDHPYSLRRNDARCIECERGRTRDPGKIKEWSRQHYLENKQKYKERSRAQYQRNRADGTWQQYRAANRGRHSEANTRWRRRNGARESELIRLEAALRRQNPPKSALDLVLAEQKLYWHLHPEEKAAERRRCSKHKRRLLYLTNRKIQLYNRNKSKARKALLRNNTVEKVTVKQIDKRFRQFKNACAYCGTDSADLHIEHVIPISKGGVHGLRNIIPACPRCNFSKSNHEVHEWYLDQPFFLESRWQKILEVLNNGTSH
jgi:hypothetical protein